MNGGAAITSWLVGFWYGTLNEAIDEGEGRSWAMFTDPSAIQRGGHHGR